MADSGQEFSGRSVDEAIAEGLAKLGIRSDQAEVEVINKGSRGIFGLGSEPARVRITRRAAATPAQSPKPPVQPTIPPAPTAQQPAQPQVPVPPIPTPAPRVTSEVPVAPPLEETHPRLSNLMDDEREEYESARGWRLGGSGQR